MTPTLLTGSRHPRQIEPWREICVSNLISHSKFLDMSRLQNLTVLEVLETLTSQLEQKFSDLKWWQKLLISSLYAWVMDFLKDAKTFIIWQKGG